MKPIEDLLRERFIVAIGLAFGTHNVVDPLLKAGDPKFADYQSNVAMPLAKRLGLPPRDVAGQIVKRLDLGGICETPAIAGPGFINLRLSREFLARSVQELAAEPRDAFRAGVDKVQDPETVVVDYSGPNVAKQMHVGHLRSTIIGDTVARTLEFLGHTVVRQNHIGDFGTQFGMLICHLRDQGLTEKPFAITDLDRWYKEATERFKKDADFAVRARQTVVELQSGAPAAVSVWNRMRVETHRHYSEVYKLLNVPLTDNDERAESFYGPRLPLLVERVRQTLEFGGEGGSVGSRTGRPAQPWDVATENLPQGVAEEVRGAVQSRDAVKRLAESQEPEVISKPFATLSDGALCIFLPGYVDKEGLPLPLMILKSDGGYPYSATDMAALYFRVQENKVTPQEQKPLDRDWHAGRVVYFTDARQAQHFAMVFDAFRAARWDRLPGGQAASLEHAPFGSILGQDRKPFKTRSSEAALLLDFLREAVESAQKAVQEKNPDLSAEKKEQVANAVGIAAIKYADLRNDRTTDYVFNSEQMVAFEGNTGPYLQYAFTRVRSIFRKSGMSPQDVAGSAINLEAPEEITLGKVLLRFPGVIESVARDLKPHYLCAFLYDLATAFSGFFEKCPVNQAPTPELKASRLLLCDLVARTLDLGLTQLLGIQTLEEM